MNKREGCKVRYFVGLSCEDYPQYGNICFCHSDLFLITETLENYCDYERDNICFSVVYLESDESKPDYWYNELDNVVEKADEGDSILFYFAGHGMSKDDDAYFLLPDTIRGMEFSTALSLTKIKTILNKSKCSTFMILDACHSGVDARDYSAFGVNLSSMDRSWATLASCSENESSFPDSDLEQGIFTYYVAKAIKEWEKNKEITIESLKVAVARNMDEWCRDKGISQHPTLNGSVVGIQSLAKRNEKKLPEEIIVYEHEEVIEKMSYEVEISNKGVPALWSASGGVELPKSADVTCVLSYNVQLKEREVASILSNYATENFEIASEFVWERAIRILRNRVLSLGLEFVGEMVGLNDLNYIRELPAFEVINLASELGFINSTGKMRLSQADEIVQHYRERDTEEEMPKNEAETVIRACMQYVLGYESAGVTMEFGNFRDSLKFELFEKQPERLMMLEGSPYFYKRTTIRTLINLLSSTEGAEYETVALNFCKILEIVWDNLSSDDKYFVGTTYSQYVNSGKENQMLTFKSALQRVHGFDYVPENLRSISFIQAAKNIKRVHHEMNNFYKEPEAVRKLEILGTQIPKPALKEAISSCILVFLGNAYGSSNAAIPYTEQVFEKINKDAWNYYVNGCLQYDDDVLSKISCGDRRTSRWCEFVKKYDLHSFEIRDKLVKELIDRASVGEAKNVRIVASSIRKKNNHDE